MPSPYEAPALWLRLIFGAATFPPETVPGDCKIEVKQKIKKSTPKTPGKNGQTITTLGLENAECKATVTFPNGTSLDGASYYDLVMAEWNKVYPPKNPAQCSHGQFGPVGMTDGQITSYDGLKWEGGKGILSFSFDGWIAPKVISGSGGGGCACTVDPKDQAQFDALKAYEAQLVAAIKADPNSSFTPVHNTELVAIRAQMKALQKSCSCVKTADKSDPAKQWMSKYGYYQAGNVGPNGQPTKGPGIPLGEIQPPQVPAP
jgi:hypothetical protein